MSVSSSLADAMGGWGGVARTIVVMFAGGQPGGGWPAVAGGECRGLWKGAVEPRW